jgi:hypothetical protein
MRRYENHEMLLDAISKVRLELNRLRGHEFTLEVSSVLIRLASLYACLDVNELKTMVQELKSLDVKHGCVHSKRKKAA